MKYNFAFLLLCLCYFPLQLNAQFCCGEDDEIKLCYLSAADYCPANQGTICSAYSLDGDFMVDALLLKLQSAANFGSNGTAGCNLTLKKLDVIQGVETINDCDCDIVFVPTVNSGTADAGTMTFIPDIVLETIYEWSLECIQNLVIVFQGESATWGYTLDNANVNPNTPVLNDFSDAIYNGPFGSVSLVEQGGSFQGVFTGLPSTGTQILAEDAAGNATIGLDLATNDLVIGDIGIFCSGGVGPITAGAQVLNDNDRFVCNIFALGCQLAASVELDDRVIEICENESATLPNGEVVSDYGNYRDTLVSFQGCDSVIRSIDVVEKIIEPFNLIYEGCSDDGYSETVNNTLYDEQNPIGQELFVTDGGCDSMVIIDLLFTVLDPSTSIASTISIGDCNSTPFNNTIPDEYTISWSNSQNLSCTDCPNPLILSGTESTYNLTLTNEFDCTWNFDIDVEYDFEIYIPNIFSPNGDGYNDNFEVGLPLNFEKERSFEIKIFDRWGAEMFSSKDWQFQWDGRYRNRLVPQGVYTYWLNFNCKMHEGSVTLIR